MEGPENNKWLDEILGEVIGAKKSEPDFGKWQAEHPEAVEMLTSRAGRQYSAGKFALSKGFRIMKSPIMKLASAAVIVIAAVIGIKSLGGTAAWAAVIEAFNNAGNVHIVKKDISSDGRIVRDIEAWIKNQTCFRAEARDWSIVDDGKNVLTLYKDQKIAHLRESFTPYWDYTPVIMKVFRDSQPENGITVRKVPEECTETVDVYRIDFRNLWQGTAWVDAGSSLPLRITGREKEYEGQTREFEVTFDYEAVADEVFSIAIPADYRELPQLGGSERQEERRQILMGKVVDERGNPVGNARVFGSFAQQGRADDAGEFSLVISPTDGSNSLGAVDFPMFVWAYEDDEPWRVAWTLVRHAECEQSEEGDAVVEETHQGVKLVINDEQELSASIPGSPGEVFEDSDGGPRVRDIVLVMGPAGVVQGRVTNATGQPIGGATVQVEEIEMALGSNRLTISNLDHEWKAEAFGVTDDQGCYSLKNLPASWTNIKLKAEADGYATGEQDFQNAGGNKLDGCDVQLVEGEQEESATTAVESGDGARGMGMYGGYRRAGE
ncbi:MAG: carboxypeptidase-like regulatory domain-containing protein [Planctomycetota bacterium]|jgi:hypothetical protein